MIADDSDAIQKKAQRAVRLLRNAFDNVLLPAALTPQKRFMRPDFTRAKDVLMGNFVRVTGDNATAINYLNSSRHAR